MTSHHTTVTEDVEQQEVTNYRNHYGCTMCCFMWTDVWTATRDSECPVCRQEASPVKSEELEPGDEDSEAEIEPRIVMSFSEAVQLFGVDRDSDPYAKAAVGIYGEEGSIEIDDKVVVSKSENGRYVMAWVFVSDEAVASSVTGD